ncbi:myosin-1B-like [Cloeon dipterum]|uniref:myosin-1B-like n=1 Tax=Cloeon dipterum TaxID=197152 RepID=UPI003220939F
MERSDSRSKLNISSTTTVTFNPRVLGNSNDADLPSSTMDQLASEEDPRNIVSEESQRKKMIKDLQVYESQLAKLKATVENFNDVVREKDRAIGNLKTGIRLLVESVGPLDSQLAQLQREKQLKKSGDLGLLVRKVEQDTTMINEFQEAISNYKADIDERSNNIAGHRERMVKELEALRAKYKQDIEKDIAGLKEVQRAHNQAKAEKNRYMEERREQMERISEVNDDCEALMREFQKFADERKAITRATKELDASIEQIQQLANSDNLASFELKVADNKRNVSLHNRQYATLQAKREQIRKQLSEEKSRNSKLTHELAEAVDEQESLERIRKNKLEELHQLIANCAEIRGECDRIAAQTAEYEREMEKKLNEVRKQSQRLSVNIQAQTQLARRNSMLYQSAAAERARREREEREQRKEELGEELAALEKTLEVVRDSCKQELEATERYFTRVEEELNLFGQDTNKDHEFEINLVRERIQRLGVRSNRELTDLDAKLLETKAQVEMEKKDYKLAVIVAQLDDAMRAAEEQEAQVRVVLEGVEQEVAALKNKLASVSKEEYDLEQQLKKLGVTPSEFDVQTISNTEEIKRNERDTSSSPAGGAHNEEGLRMVLQQKAAEVKQSMQQLGWNAPQEKLIATMENLAGIPHTKVSYRMQDAASQMENILRSDQSKIDALKEGSSAKPPNKG